MMLITAAIRALAAGLLVGFIVHWLDGPGWASGGFAMVTIVVILEGANR